MAERCFGEGLVGSNDGAAGESLRVEGEVAVECAGERDLNGRASGCDGISTECERL